MTGSGAGAGAFSAPPDGEVMHEHVTEWFAAPLGGISEPILDSLYRWRAKGQKLTELKKGETFDVKLRFMLR